jgi:small conductance mechanosensitive channel
MITPAVEADLSFVAGIPLISALFKEVDLAGVQRLLIAGVTSIVLIIAAYFVARLMGRWVSAAICKRVDETLGRFAGKFTFYAVMICSSLGILGTAGLDTAGVAAVLTAAGFAIGLAFQGTLSNFASGILLLVFRPFKVGDMVNVAGVIGKVNEIDLFTTTLDTTDNRRLIIPNSSISGATIENITFHPHRRVEVHVGTAYRSDLRATRSALEEAAEALRPLMIEGEGRGYQVLLINLGNSSIEWTVRFWTASKDFFTAKESLTQEIKLRLDQAGISIPFPQMHIHWDQQTAPDLPVPVTDESSISLQVPRLRKPLHKAG